MTSTPQHDLNEQKTQVQDYFSHTAERYVASFSHRAGDDLKRLADGHLESFTNDFILLKGWKS
jgi:hypothetical protein